MYAEHSTVKLLIDLPEHDLKAGEEGVIVFIYRQGEGYALEFFTQEGRTKDVVTVNAEDVTQEGL